MQVRSMLIYRAVTKGPFASHRALARFAKRQIEFFGAIAAPAIYSHGGNCIFCGEAGRCPGYHAIFDWRNEP